MVTQADVDLANAAIRRKVLTKDEASRCLHQFRDFNRADAEKRFGQYLVEKGILSREEVHSLTAEAAARTPPPISKAAPATHAVPPPVAATPAPLAPKPMAPRSAPLTTPPTVPERSTDSSIRRATALTPPPVHPKPSSAAVPAAKVGAPTESPIPGIQIVGKIGAGGTATVFRAVLAEDGREIALKILYPHHAKLPVYVARFQRESELLCTFEHPNIVKGIRHGISTGLHWIAMDLIQGDSVQSLIDARKTLDEETALSVIVQLARALDYMQTQGYVHRDIKPDNLFVRADGALQLCDLGFAKPIGAAEDPENMTCGTPQYMSPEQAQGQSDLDVRSDIYSLGATLYHMVLGEVPFTGGDNMEIMAAQCLAELKSSSVKSGRISHHMHYFIEKMMAKEKEIRYQNPAEVAEDIQAQMEGFKSLEYHGDERRAAPRTPHAMKPKGKPSSDSTRRGVTPADPMRFFRRPS